MNNILFASGNYGKFNEIKALFKKFQLDDYQLLFAGDLSNLTEPEENGHSFTENAIIKAKYYGESTNMIALADDSGLSIPRINNLPGLYSARFAVNPNGKKDFNYAFGKIYKMLKDKNLDPEIENIEAYFTCSLAIFNPHNQKLHSFEAKVNGKLRFPPIGNLGFGYDPIFIRNGDNKTFGEIGSDEKDNISHRGLVFIDFAKFLHKNNAIFHLKSEI
jgi:XTP/dITP diphosphohydrolase